LTCSIQKFEQASDEKKGWCGGIAFVLVRNRVGLVEEDGFPVPPAMTVASTPLPEFCGGRRNIFLDISALFSLVSV